MTAQEILRREADRYMREDGTAGELSIIWGWRAIGTELRRIADMIDEPKKTSAITKVRGGWPHSGTDL